MKKFLPIFLIFVFIFSFLFSSFQPVFADTSPTDTGTWVSDAEVNFVGKTGVRSGDFLDWALQNYSWLCVTKVSQNQCDNKNDPLIPFWIVIRNIVYALVALFILATAFILIITRGQSITVMRFIPRFVFVIILITLSFSLVQFVYQVSDIIQDFFLKTGGKYISTQDLLYIGFDYKKFAGYRRSGMEFDESAFISLLLVKLTAITYYVMTGILLIRKIILWFFIIISPVFPLLLFYKPIRNTAKIWIGEFFRWLLYAPLFAIFLNGLVNIWRSGIPLPFKTPGQVPGTDVVYPTAINILLGGPGQAIGLTNSVNLRDTFALYVVALLMLWVVILLPFLLLNIFLDYIATISFENNVALRQFMGRNLGFLNPSKGLPPQAPPPSPGLSQPAGAARTLPFFAKKGAAAPVEVGINLQAQIRESADILRLANLSIPKMRDVAKYEVSLMSRDAGRRNEATQFHNNLAKIANPTVVAIPGEREKFSTVRQKLLQEKQKGNPVASSVLAASQISTTSQKIVTSREEQVSHITQTLNNMANPASMPVSPEKEKMITMKEQLMQEKEKGNTLASSILETSEKLSSKDVAEDQKNKFTNQLLDQLLDEEKKGNVIASKILGELKAQKLSRQTVLPNENKVQQVSVDDYEEVRKLWTENYQTIEPPKDLAGNEVERREWIKNDIDKINEAIVLLSSLEPEKVNQGMEMVAGILPFLLIGGFSKSEVVSYLKAKMEAGKSVLTELQKKEEEDETMVSREKIEKPKEMAEEAAISQVENNGTLNNNSNSGEKSEEENNG